MYFLSNLRFPRSPKLSLASEPVAKAIPLAAVACVGLRARASYGGILYADIPAGGRPMLVMTLFHQELFLRQFYQTCVRRFTVECVDFFNDERISWLNSV